MSHPKAAGSYIGTGDAQTRDTLARMRKLIYDASDDAQVVQLARTIVAGVSGHDFTAQARAVRAWLVKHFRFVRDPRSIELLEEPSVHIRNVQRTGYTQGDCDDAATLGAALASAIGMDGQLTAEAFMFKDAPYQHVFAVLNTPAGPLDLDTTRPQSIPFGAILSSVSRRFSLPF